MQEAVIVDCVRTAVGKAGRGSLKNTRPDDLAAFAIRGLLERHPQVHVASIEDVILGCAMPEGEAGLNMARIAALRAGLPDSVPGVTINRFCSSGLQSIAMAAERIRSGGAEIIVAGGAESMSMVPMTGNKFSANPWMVDHLPGIYMSMGLTAEQVYQNTGYRARSRINSRWRVIRKLWRRRQRESSMKRLCRWTSKARRWTAAAL
jgi:acetyl-CoA acyltransferase